MGLWAKYKEFASKPGAMVTLASACAIVLGVVLVVTITQLFQRQSELGKSMKRVARKQGQTSQANQRLIRVLCHEIAQHRIRTEPQNGISEQECQRLITEGKVNQDRRQQRRSEFGRAKDQAGASGFPSSDEGPKREPPDQPSNPPPSSAPPTRSPSPTPTRSPGVVPPVCLRVGDERVCVRSPLVWLWLYLDLGRG